LREACLQSRDFNNENRRRGLDRYRKAGCRQIFTAAPDIAAVNWKRAHLDDALFAGAKKERVERVLAV
jgi:hypothetical protein